MYTWVFIHPLFRTHIIQLCHKVGKFMPVYVIPKPHRTYNYTIMHYVPATISNSVLYCFNLRCIVAICTDMFKTPNLFCKVAKAVSISALISSYLFAIKS